MSVHDTKANIAVARHDVRFQMRGGHRQWAYSIMGVMRTIVSGVLFDDYVPGGYSMIDLFEMNYQRNASE